MALVRDFGEIAKYVKSRGTPLLGVDQYLPVIPDEAQNAACHKQSAYQWRGLGSQYHNWKQQQERQPCVHPLTVLRDGSVRIPFLRDVLPKYLANREGILDPHRPDFLLGRLTLGSTAAR